MKKALLVIALGAAALIGFNYYRTGKITLIPFPALSAEEEEVVGLEVRLKDARSSFSRAGRGAGMTGLDTTADAEAARIEVERIDKRFMELKRKATAKSGAAIDRLEKKLEEAKRELGIP